MPYEIPDRADHQPITWGEFKEYERDSEGAQQIVGGIHRTFMNDTLNRLKNLEDGAQNHATIQQVKAIEDRSGPKWVKVALPVTAIAAVGGLSLAAYQGLNPPKNPMNYSV